MIFEHTRLMSVQGYHLFVARLLLIKGKLFIENAAC